MTLNTIDESQRKAARVAGFAFLFAMTLVVIANYGIPDFPL
jgi:ABC-type amino acid transport system permease subunit